MKAYDLAFRVKSFLSNLIFCVKNDLQLSQWPLVWVDDTLNKNFFLSFLSLTTDLICKDSRAM